MVKNKKVWLAILILIAIEQGIKILINKYYLQMNKPILKSWVYFRPLFNRDYSWFNSMLQLNIGKWIHIAVVLIVISIVFWCYRYFADKLEIGIVIDVLFAFIFSGAVCSLIDKVFWNGSLDYISLTGLFTFDLKDVYINIFNVLLVFIILIDYKGIKKQIKAIL